VARADIPGKIRLSLRNLWEEVCIALACFCRSPSFFSAGNAIPTEPGVFLQPDQPGQAGRLFHHHSIFLSAIWHPARDIVCGSCIFLLFEKEYSQDGFYLSLVFLYPVFFAVDTLIYTGTAGLICLYYRGIGRSGNFFCGN